MEGGLEGRKSMVIFIGGMEVVYEGIRINGGGNTYLLSVFLNPGNRSATLNAGRMIWIQVFQNDQELYGLAGKEKIVGLK